MKFKTFVKKHFSQKRYGEVILHEDLAAETIKAIKDAVASPYETRQQLQRWGYRMKALSTILIVALLSGCAHQVGTEIGYTEEPIYTVKTEVIDNDIVNYVVVDRENYDFAVADVASSYDSCFTDVTDFDGDDVYVTVVCAEHKKEK